MQTVVPSDNQSLGFLTPSRTFLCLYMRHTPPRCTRVCVLFLSRYCVALSRHVSLSRSPRVSLSRSRAWLSLFGATCLYRSLSCTLACTSLSLVVSRLSRALSCLLVSLSLPLELAPLHERYSEFRIQQLMLNSLTHARCKIQYST